MKKKIKEIPNDEIRQRILEFLNSKRKKARSLASIPATITDIKKNLKKDGISQSEVVINLDYLVQNSWVKEEIEKKIYTTPKGFNVPSEKRAYKLTELGIKHFEGSSAFDISQSFSGINISNIHGVTVVGTHNIVRAEFIDLFRKLDQLESSMKMSDKLTDEQKLAGHSDIQTIKEQLSKTIPDKNILKKALTAISFLGSIPGLIQVFNVVKLAVESLLR